MKWARANGIAQDVENKINHLSDGGACVLCMLINIVIGPQKYRCTCDTVTALAMLCTRLVLSHLHIRMPSGCNAAMASSFASSLGVATRT